MFGTCQNTKSVLHWARCPVLTDEDGRRGPTTKNMAIFFVVGPREGEGELPKTRNTPIQAYFSSSAGWQMGGDELNTQNTPHGMLWVFG